MGYRDEWQGWIWDTEINDKDGYGIKSWMKRMDMTRMDMGYRDEWQGWIWDTKINDKNGYGIQR